MFGMEASEATKMTDMLAYAQANSNTDVQQLGEALKYCGASANAMGYDLADTTALLGTFADQGLKGSSAGTTLNAMFRDMKKNAKDGAIAIGDTNVAIVDANGNYRDMTDILADVEKATEGMTQAERDMALSSIWGTEALKGVNMAFEAGVPKIREFEEGIRSSDGAAGEMYDTMQNNLKGAIDNMKSAFEGVIITIGERLIPIFQNLVEGITNVLTWFNNLNPAIQNVIIGVGGFLAILGPLLLIIGNIIIFITNLGAAIGTLVTFFSAGGAGAGILSAAIAAITGPVGLVIAGITALIAIGVLLYKNWDEIKAKCIEIWQNSIKPTIEAVTNTLKAFLTAAWEGIKVFLETCWNLLKQLASTVWNAIKSAIETLSNAIKSVITTVWNAIKTVITNTWNTIKTTTTNVVNGIKSVITTTFNAIKSVITTVVNGWKNIITTAWNSIKSVVQTTVNGVKSVIQSVFNAIQSIIQASSNGWKAAIQAAWNGIKSVVQTGTNAIRSTISSVFSALSNIMTAPFRTAQSVISGILGGISRTISSITSAAKKVTSLFKTVEPPMQDQESLYNEVDYSKARFNYAKAKQTTISDVMATNYSMLESFKDFGRSIKTDNKEAKVNNENSININLNIDKFMNETNQSIDDLMDEIAFRLKRKALF